MNKLKELRLEHKMSQSELALRFNVSQAVVSAWERGSCKMSSSMLINVANFFGVSVDYLLGNGTDRAQKIRKSIVLPPQNVKEIPAAGILTQDEIESSEYMCLCVIGDSMEPDMREGDIAIIRRGSKYGTGSVIALAVGGECRSLQLLTETDTSMILRSISSKYGVIVYDQDQLRSHSVHIVGNLIEVRRRYV